jgi:hypothetical protein
VARPRRSSDTHPTSQSDGDALARSPAAPQVGLEIGLIFLLFFLIAGWLPPDVNEAHYLSKARHYWDPAWCPRDPFLNSADAHTVFYWTFGWLTCWLPLPAVAWIGRLLTWWLLAWAWRRLSFALIAQPLVAVLSAGIFLPLQILGQMAGEWVIGGVEAKGFAYVLVLLGLEALVRERWRAVWILLGAAAAFHVLVGGWSVLAAAVAYGLSGPQRPPLRRILPALLLGGLLALPGLLPAVALNWGQGASEMREANQIYVYLRLPHHLVPWRFAWPGVVAHGIVVAMWLSTAWFLRRDPHQRRLQSFVLGALIITATGLVVSLLPRNLVATSLLRFYWFRLGDVAVPLGAAMGLSGVLVACLTGPRREAGRAALVGVVSLCMAFLGYHSWMELRDFRPASEKQTRPLNRVAIGASQQGPEPLRQVYDDWVRLGRWIQDNTEPDAIFITPRMQQTFHWFAHRSEVACWKDVPQDAASLLPWWNRLQRLYPPEVIRGGLAQHDPEELGRLAREFGAQYIVLDRTLSQRPLGMTRLYPNLEQGNASFEVYLVPPPVPGSHPNRENDDRPLDR